MASNKEVIMKIIIRTIILVVLFTATLVPQAVSDEAITEIDLFSEDELITVAAKKPQTLAEAPSIVTVITADQIRRRGYHTLADAMESIMGFYVWRDLINPSITIRGFNAVRAWNQNLKIMIDGQPISLRFSTGNIIDYSLIPICAVERIEIIRGPASSLYGANAYLGVINIITKKENQNSIALAYGNRDTYNLDMCIMKKSNDFDLTLAISHFNQDKNGLSIPDTNVMSDDLVSDLPKGKFETSEEDIMKPSSFYGRLNYKGFSLISNFQYQDNYAEFSDWGVLTHSNRINSMNWFIKAEYLKFIKKNTIKTSIAFSQGGPTDKDRLEVNSDKYWIRRELNYSGMDINLEGTYNLHKNHITTGIDYTQDKHQLQNNWAVFKIDNAYGLPVKAGDEMLAQELVQRLYGLPITAQPFGKKTFTNIGIYLQDLFYPTEKLGLTVGYRFDNHNIYGNVHNYRLAGVYEFSTNFYMKLLYGTSFKPPTPRQLFDQPSRPGGTQGNSLLEPQTAITREFALGVKPIKNILITFNLFKNTIDSFIGYDETNKMNNIGSFTSNGAEGEIKLSFGNFSSYLNTSYQDTTDDSTGEETSLVPKNTSNLGINYLFFNKLNLNLETHYVGEIISPKEASGTQIAIPDYSLDSYIIHNLTISTQGLKLFSKNETVFSCNLKNISNEKYSYPGYGTDDLRIDIPCLGRTFLFTATQYF